MTRTILATLAIALFLPVVYAQTPPRDATRLLAPAGSSVISGVVVDAENKPMRRVAVRIEGDPRASRTVMTDDSGRFAFAKVPAGEFFLRATKPAFPATSYGAKRPGRAGVRLQIKDGTRFDNIVLKMDRGAVLTGTVFNERGQPVPGVSMSVYRAYTGLDGAFATSSVSSGSGYPSTDDRGQFRFYGLPAGEYIIGTSPFFGSGSSARVPSDDEIRAAFAKAEQAIEAGATQPVKTSPPASPQMDYAPIYYPDAPNALDAARIRVVAGEERTGLDVRLVLRPMAAIAGQVSGTTSFESIELLLVSKRSTMHTGLNKDGSFNLKGLSAGDYTVAVRTSGPNQLVSSYDVTLNGRDASGINLVLGPPPSVSGRVQFQQKGSSPLPAFSQVRVSALPVAGTGTPATVTAAADGSFVLQGMLPGTYQIATTVAGVSGSSMPFTMISTTIADRDVTDSPVVIRAGSPIESVAITLSDDAAELSGHLLMADGKAGTDFYVVAVAADQKYWMWSSRRIKSTRPDGSGRFVFTGLPPGTYRIAATTDLENSDLSDRAFLEQILAASAEVIVGPAEKKIFDLKIGGL